MAAAAACSADADTDATQPDGETAEEALTGPEPRPLTTVDDYAPMTLEDRVVTAAIEPGSGRATLVEGQRLAIVRKMTYAGKPSMLGFVVDSRAAVILDRATLDRATRVATPADGPNRYAEVLRASAEASATLDHLVARSPEGQLRAAVTIDMCQSSKPWERALFDFFVRLADETGKPVPVGIAMTGGWAKAHGTELAQLREWGARGKLDITWINHSYTHPLNCNADRSSCGFLSARGVEVDKEVLENERFMLRQDLGLSPLFRFPGLIHDARTRKVVSNLGLFALDANAWLAKGQPMKDASVVLLHGNGNEPRGIQLFMAAMRETRWQRGLRDGSARLVSPLEAIER